MRRKTVKLMLAMVALLAPLFPFSPSVTIKQKKVCKKKHTARMCLHRKERGKKKASISFSGVAWLCDRPLALGTKLPFYSLLTTSQITKTSADDSGTGRQACRQVECHTFQVSTCLHRWTNTTAAAANVSTRRNLKSVNSSSGSCTAEQNSTAIT